MSFVQSTVAPSFVVATKDVELTVKGAKGPQAIVVPAGTQIAQALFATFTQLVDGCYSGSCVFELTSTFTKDGFKDLRDKVLEPALGAKMDAFCQGSCSAEELMAYAQSLALAHTINWRTFQDKPVEPKDTPFLCQIAGALAYAPTTFRGLANTISKIRSLRADPAAYIVALVPYLKVVLGESVESISKTDAYLIAKESKWALGDALKKAPDATVQTLYDQVYGEDKGADGKVVKRPHQVAMDQAKSDFAELPGSAEICAIYALNPVATA